MNRTVIKRLAAATTIPKLDPLSNQHAREQLQWRMLDPLSAAIGAVLLTAGWLSGHLSARRAQRQRHDPPPKPVCGCGHHRALHDPDTDECHARQRWPGYDWVPCTCRQYVGPEPISLAWIPPVAETDSQR